MYSLTTHQTCPTRIARVTVSVAYAGWIYFRWDLLTNSAGGARVVLHYRVPVSPPILHGSRFQMRQFQQGFDGCFDGFEDLIDVSRCVDDMEAIRLHHFVEFGKHPFLVLGKALVHVLAEVHVHARFPVVKAI